MVRKLRMLLRARRFSKLQQKAKEEADYEFFRALADQARAKRITSYIWK